MPDPYVAQLGRISGALLSPNLLRNGVDLSFRNATASPDLLYLDVNNMKVGVKTSSPVYDLDVNSIIKTDNLDIANRGTLDNVVVQVPNTFSTTVGALHVRPGQNTTLFHDKLQTSVLELNDNVIGSISNGNIVLDPNGSGTVEFQANTNITGNLFTTGNIRMDGNLQTAGTVTVGDSPLDVVTIVPDFTQSIIPGQTITYDLGKPAKRWFALYSDIWETIDNIRPQSVTISEQMLIDGVANKISGIQSNEDILLNPDTGIVYIERTKWEGNEITNLDNTPLTFVNTGIGYLRFVGENAVVIPSGTNIERPANPELGATRWNTEIGYLEIWNGSIWVVSTGGGEEVTTPIMEDLSNVWSLILG